MSSKALLGIIAAVVVVGGGAWYLSTSKGTTEGAPTAGNENEEAETNAGSGTFADLMMRAGSWKCTVTTTIEEAPSSGTVYVAGGKVRADFVSKPAALNGAEVASSMIQMDGYVYTWTDAFPQGMKMKIPEGNNTQGSSQAGVDYSSKVDYDCGAWSVDASMFTPPASVTFMELGEGGMPGSIPTPN